MFDSLCEHTCATGDTVVCLCMCVCVCVCMYVCMCETSAHTSQNLCIETRACVLHVCTQYEKRGGGCVVFLIV